MANEKRLIDANVILKEKTVLWDTALGFCGCVLVEDIDKAPTVDAVEVVRCKDCKDYHKNTCPLRTWAYTKPDDFCSYGERRSDEIH